MLLCLEYRLTGNQSGKDIINRPLTLSVLISTIICFFLKCFPFGRESGSNIQRPQMKNILQLESSNLKLLLCVNISFSHYQCIYFKEVRFVHATTATILCENTLRLHHPRLVGCVITGNALHISILLIPMF